MCFKPVLAVVLLLNLGACASTPPAPRAAETVAGPVSSPPPVPPQDPYENAATAPGWNYPEDEHWDPACRSTSYQQSPIDFRGVSATPWNASYVVTQATLDPYERNVVFMPTPGPAVLFNPEVGNRSRRRTFTPAGFHFHNGGEHRVQEAALLELHIKATDAAGSVAVFALQWMAGGGADPTLGAAIASLGTQPGEPRALDMSRLLHRFGEEPFYSYLGSLTTPPCTGNIRWFVLKNPLRASMAQINQLRAGLVAKGVSAHNVRTTRPLMSPQPEIFLVEPRESLP